MGIITLLKYTEYFAFRIYIITNNPGGCYLFMDAIMTNLQIGDKAPLFCAENQEGRKICLKDLKGKNVVLFFYPHDDTPTCVKQACNLRDNYSALQKAGYEVVGVNMDSVKSHMKFIRKYDLPYQLLSDPDGKIVNLYGVYGEKQFMGRNFLGIHRITFLIDKKGKITDIIEKVKSAEHHHQILADETA